MIQSLEKTTGRISPCPELLIDVKMADGEKLVTVKACGYNSASIEWDRYQDALRVAEEAIYAAFFPDEVFKRHVADSRRQPGQAGHTPTEISASDCRKDDPLCRLGDEGPVPSSEAP